MNRITMLLALVASIFAPTSLALAQATADTTTTTHGPALVWITTRTIQHQAAPTCTTCNPPQAQPQPPTAPVPAAKPVGATTARVIFPKDTVVIPRADYEDLMTKATTMPPQASQPSPTAITVMAPPNPELQAALRNNQAELETLKAAIDKLATTGGTADTDTTDQLLTQLVAAQNKANDLQAQANKIAKGRAGSERHQTFFIAVGDGIDVLHTGFDAYRDIKGTNVEVAQSQSQVAMAKQLAAQLQSVTARAMAKSIVYVP
jgi:hypothetical protein